MAECSECGVINGGPLDHEGNCEQGYSELRRAAIKTQRFVIDVRNVVGLGGSDVGFDEILARVREAVSAEKANVELGARIVKLKPLADQWLEHKRSQTQFLGQLEKMLDERGLGKRNPA